MLVEIGQQEIDSGSAYQSEWKSVIKTVERIIGSKTGTGGSSGVSYLKLAIDRYFYPELWEVRGAL